MDCELTHNRDDTRTAIRLYLIHEDLVGTADRLRRLRRAHLTLRGQPRVIMEQYAVLIHSIPSHICTACFLDTNNQFTIWRTAYERKIKKRHPRAQGDLDFPIPTRRAFAKRWVGQPAVFWSLAGGRLLSFALQESVSHF